MICLSPNFCYFLFLHHDTFWWNIILILFSYVDVALVTSLRDGMNLVSYEFVACQGEKKGVLILSEVITSDPCLFALFLSYTCVLILFPAKHSQVFKLCVCH